MDGDADRLGVVDDRGIYLTPHQVFPLLTLYGIEHKGWKGKIVQSVSMGALGERIAHAYGFPFEEVPVGFKHIADRMVQGSVLAGGEESGGYAFSGGLPERDGVLNGLLFLEMCLVTGKKPSQLLQRMQKRFGTVCFHRNDMGLNRAILDKEGFVERVQRKLPKRLIDQSIKEVRAQDGLKIILSKGAWVLLRPSGTEPLLRTYAESPNAKQTQELLTWAGSAAKEALS